MGCVYVARSKILQAWGAEVGLGKNTLFKLGLAEDSDAPAALSGLAGMSDWEVLESRPADGVDESALLERLARKEKLVDPTYYPKLRGATGVVKVNLAAVENAMRIRLALENGAEPKSVKVKPADIARYLLNNALG